MSTNSSPRTPSLTRREALLAAIKGTVVAAAPVVAQAAPTAPTSPPEPEFVPENDYPFFGGSVPEGY
jgi:hypothetical protein